MEKLNAYLEINNENIIRKEEKISYNIQIEKSSSMMNPVKFLKRWQTHTTEQHLPWSRQNESYIFIFSLASYGLPANAGQTKFSDAPDVLKEKCPALEKVKDDVKLSELTKTIAINYTTYYDCQVKVDAWIEWYKVQKEIFDSVK